MTVDPTWSFAQAGVRNMVMRRGVELGTVSGVIEKLEEFCKQTAYLEFRWPLWPLV